MSQSLTGGVPQFTRMGLCEHCMMINLFLKGAYKRPGFSESMVVDLLGKNTGVGCHFLL